MLIGRNGVIFRKIEYYSEEQRFIQGNSLLLRRIGVIQGNSVLVKGIKSCPEEQRVIHGNRLIFRGITCYLDGNSVLFKKIVYYSGEQLGVKGRIGCYSEEQTYIQRNNVLFRREQRVIQGNRVLCGGINSLLLGIAWHSRANFKRGKFIRENKRGGKKKILKAYGKNPKSCV